MEPNVVLIHPRDNVAVAIRAIQPGEALVGAPGHAITAAAEIPKNHKAAIREIPENAEVIKYGEPIGRAGVRIRPGEWVHTHNLKSGG